MVPLKINQTLLTIANNVNTKLYALKYIKLVRLCETIKKLKRK